MASTLRTALIVLFVTALLTGCAPAQGGEPDMDKAAVQTALTAIDGVESAHVGAFNTGAPGAYSLRIALTVDEAGLAGLGDVIDGSVQVLAADAGGYQDYIFEVTAPDASEPGEQIVITLGDHSDEIPLAVGRYSGSTLTLTADELAAAAR